MITSAFGMPSPDPGVTHSVTIYRNITCRRFPIGRHRILHPYQPIIMLSMLTAREPFSPHGQLSKFPSFQLSALKVSLFFLFLAYLIPRSFSCLSLFSIILFTSKANYCLHELVVTATTDSTLKRCGTALSWNSLIGHECMT